MTTYKQFHGEVPIDMIGKELRLIVARHESFKILTGYGSTYGHCKSKTAALKSLGRMWREGLIKGYIPAEKVTELIMDPHDNYLKVKMQYWSILKNDRDRGNNGIIYVFC